MHDSLTSLIDELDRLRASRDDAWQIPRVEGDLLYHIALAVNAQIIVEVGTSYGFSALNWAKAIRQTGGHLHTIDRDEKKYHSSRETFARAGVESIITSHFGDAQAILRTLVGPIDIGFIDADKPSTRAYFGLLWPLVRVGGCVIIDNATTHKKELADVISHVRSLPDASSVEVAVGNGIEWTIKTK